MNSESLSAIRKFTARRRLGLLTRRAGALGVAAAFVYLLISAVFGIAFAAFPWTALPVAWMGVTLLAASVVILLPVVMIVRKPSLVKVARVIEEKSDLEHPSLSIALELSQQSDTGGSPSLKELTYIRAANEVSILDKVKFPFVNHKFLLVTLILLVINILTVIISPNKMSSYWKLPFAMIAGERVRVGPGSIVVPMNGSVTLTLSGAARHYPTARLETRPLDGQHGERRFLRADTAGTFSFTVDNIRESFVYQFSLSSPEPPETVTVVPPPLLRSLQITLVPPRYTKLPPRELPAGQGNITAYPGTKVGVTLESGMLKEAGIIIGDKDTLRLDVTGKIAAGSFRAERSVEYTFCILDTLNQPSDSLPRFMVNILPDEPPAARIIKPGMNKVLMAAQVETLWVEGTDDFGIGKMELRWRQGGDKSAADSYDLSEKGQPPLIRKPVVWNIRELGLYPGDTLFYYLWVRDNKSFGRAQTAASDTFWFRVPSFEEIHEGIVQREQYAQEKIGQVRSRQDEINSAIDKLVKSATGGSRELTWDQKRVVEEVKQQMQAQADSLQKAFEALEEGIEAMREDGKLDAELFAKMEQIKKSVEELMKEFGEELFKMNNDRPMTMSDMRQAASQLKNMLPELSERLEQTLAFLEKVRQEKELADLAVRAENLSAEQADLAAAQGGEIDDKRQSDLLDRIDNFNADVQNFFKQRSQETPSSSKNVGEQSKEMRRKAAENDQCKDGKGCKDSKGGKDSKSNSDSKDDKNKMSRELLSLSEQLKDNLMVNMMAKVEEDRKRVLSMAHDALTLDEWQRVIRAQSLGTEDNRGVAMAQQALGNALRVSLIKADSLTMVGANDMREIVRAYRGALSRSSAVIASLADSDGTAQMERSRQALRELANILLSITGGEDEGGGGGSGSMMSGLRRASGKQAALNSMMGGLLNSMLAGGGRPQGQGRGQQQGEQRGQGQGGGDQEGGDTPGGETGGGGGEREREARRQAREAQQAIADELKRIADAYGKESGEQMEKRVRELEEEARRLAQLLENPPADIIDQQDRFLSRMLQSTLSMNRKDEGKEERKGAAAQTMFTDRAVSAAPSSAIGADSFHLLRKRAFEDNFPEEYRAAIREYFDALGEMKWE